MNIFASQWSDVMRTVIAYWQKLEYLIKQNKCSFHTSEEQYKWLWHWNWGLKTKQKQSNQRSKRDFQKWADRRKALVMCQCCSVLPRHEEENEQLSRHGIFPFPLTSRRCQTGTRIRTSEQPKWKHTEGVCEGKRRPYPEHVPASARRRHTVVFLVKRKGGGKGTCALREFGTWSKQSEALKSVKSASRWALSLFLEDWGPNPLAPLLSSEWGLRRPQPGGLPLLNDRVHSLFRQDLP